MFHFSKSSDPKLEQKFPPLVFGSKVSHEVFKKSINILLRKFQIPFLFLPLDQISSRCEYAILEENSSDHTEKNSMISGFNLSQSNLEYDEGNELPMQSSISHDNQVYISQNDPEKSSMISGFNLSQCSLENDAGNELPMQSSISHENQVYISQNDPEMSSMISGFNLSQCSLKYDEGNELPRQSSISHENQVYISQNEFLNSQPTNQNPAVIGKQKIIRHPKIFIGTLMILIVMGAGIVILVSRTIQKKGDRKLFIN